MSQKVTVDGLADAINKELKEYAKSTSESVKDAVKKTGKSVRKDISDAAPKRTGAYAKSWSVKTTKETSTSLQVTVYSRNRYQLAHLLEHGHAKRGGGRVAARPHIAPAEERGEKQLENMIRKGIEK
ncbi:MAG: HK97 gp10 family phage protein [Eubacterium sp.]|jgi:type IV secretory pathway TrbL component|nr:HK97 gp10 family phage protein [Eubacterium sp.]MCH4078693.1 HK97 gp10 family phage protein [Eubacterium sp.]MCH4109834.1 HK97 gp10 family phage protein [Eubacterium sp.]MCI1307042.1 HK97 gp10 family phage protein [Eubacterium sp.]